MQAHYATAIAEPHLVAVGAGAGGGPQVMVYDAQTNREIYSFYAFDPRFTGGVRVATGDVTGDGTVDNNDLNEIAAEINLSNPVGLAPLGADVNGDGVVSAVDLTLATRAKGHKLKGGLSLG